MNTKKIAMLATLVACQVIAGRYLSISTLYIKIGFTFLPIAITAILYGPAYSGVSAALGDVISALLSPFGYFPWFTLSAFITGTAYGLFLYHKPKSIWRIICCVLTINIAISIFLQAYWLVLLTGQEYTALLVTRIIQNAITIPVQIICIRLIVYPVTEIELKKY